MNAKLPSEIFYPSGRLRPERRVVNGRVEFAFPCPIGCHGFGLCRVCGDTGRVWRRPRPWGGMR